MGSGDGVIVNVGLKRGVGVWLGVWVSSGGSVGIGSSEREEQANITEPSTNPRMVRVVFIVFLYW
jgi:hypothetical protein